MDAKANWTKLILEKKYIFSLEFNSSSQMGDRYEFLQKSIPLLQILALVGRMRTIRQANIEQGHGTLMTF